MSAMIVKPKWRKPGSEDASPLSPPENRALGGRRSVLVVDDDPISGRVIREILGERGFDVDTSSSARPALEKIRCRQYDVLIVDIFLPHRDGRSLHTSVLSADPELAQRTLFISSWEPAGPMADYVRTHGLFLKKPFSEEDLLEKVRSMSGSHSGDAVV